MSMFAVTNEALSRLCAIIVFCFFWQSCDVGAVVRAEEAAQTTEPRRVHFIITKHVILHDGKIVTWDEVEQILDKAAESGKIRPVFHSTNGAIPRQEELRKHRWRLYKKLYDAGKTDGMTVGFLSPRAGERLDRIEDPKDLVQDPSKKLFGRVLDVDGESLEQVEVFLLPEQHINGVYLRDGKVRNPLEEHLTRSAADGSFVIYPDEDEKLIAAVHPNGFVIATLSEFRKTGHLRLKPWVRVHGSRPTDGPDAKQTICFTSYPVSGMSFHVYETNFLRDGSFHQKYVPPGSITISRDVPIGNGGTRSFVVERLTLAPGDDRKVTLGPIPDPVKRQLKDR